jgi:hypothetical protein
VIRFIAGVIVGAAGSVYVIGVLLSSSTESRSEFPSVWETNTDDDPQWTWTTHGTPLT